MTSLYIDRRNCHLALDAGALVFHENGERVGTVPLAPISRVIIRGSVTLEASLLGHLGENGTGVVFLSGRKGLPTLFLGRAHSDATRRVAQTRLSLDAAFCLHVSRQLVYNKIQRQLQWFEELRQQYPQHRYPLTHAMQLLTGQLDQVAKCRNLESLRGMEGSAAAGYFAGLRAVVPESWGFNERNRRPPRDPFNALLSLTYTLLMAEVTLALHNAGFDPCVGYYHQISHARESLACDMIEPLRPLADRLCLKMVASQELTTEHFSTSVTGCLLGKAGRVRYYAAYEENIPPVRRILAEDVKALARLITPELPEPSPVTYASASDPGAWAPAEEGADKGTPNE